jgi:uncharacterized membrane protein (UPF0127 family)
MVTVPLGSLVPACTRSDARGHDAAPPQSAEPGAVRRDPVSAEPASMAASNRTQGCVVPSPPEAPPAAAPAASCPADPTGPPELAWGAITFVDAPQNPRIRVELAESDPTRARGLMYRTSLEQDQGMLFVFPDERRRSFWMKNTCIPLDMLFIDKSGTIVGILENVPTLSQVSRGVPCPAAYVLEVNAGWTREQGVFAGQRLEIDR